MAGTPANSMNLNATIAGIVNWDGVNVMSVTPLTQYCTLAAGSSKTIAQISPSTSGYVLTSNGPGAFPTYQPASGSLTSTLTGDSGVATSSSNNINVISTSTSGSSTSFTGSGSTLTFNVTDSNNNTFIGKSSGAGTAGGQWSTSLGEESLQSITTGAGVTAVGYQAAKSLLSGTDGVYIGYKSGELSTGSCSVFVGSQTARNITSGSYNVIIGYGSGSGYTSTEASNVLLNSAGTAGDANTIRIGIQGSSTQQQNKCFIAGITGVSTSNTKLVTIDSTTGQLGDTSLPITVSQGGTGVSSNTAYAVLCGGTTSTGAVQSIASVGTSGQVLTSNGAGALPTFQGNGLGTISYATVTLTSAQIKALHATPILIVPAPGANKCIQPIAAGYKFTYGGSNVFTAAAAQTINLVYNSTATANFTIDLLTNANIVSNATIYGFPAANFLHNKTTTEVENAGIYAYNTVATEISGNAANNNTITISVCYYVVG